MRWTILLALALFFPGCNEVKSEKVDNLKKSNVTSEASVSKQYTGCVDSFKKFRDDIYHGRREMVRNHFSFPIPDIEIWYAVQDDNFNSKDFTDDDFNTYYDQLFPKEFVQSLLKVKSQELFERGYYKTPKLSKKEGALEIKNYLFA